MSSKVDQLKTVVMFAATLANCGVKASADSTTLGKAADFLPLIEDIPGLVEVNASELKAEFTALDADGRAELVADVAAELNIGPAVLNAKIDALVDVGLDIASAISRGVTAWGA